MISEVRSTSPDPSSLLTIFSKAAEPVFETYCELGLIDAGDFSQPFMVLDLNDSTFDDHLQLNDLAFEHEISQRAQVLEHEITFEGRVVSVSKASLNSNGVSYIWGMHTNSDFRRNGLASHGLDAALKASKGCGMHSAVLCTSPLGEPFYLAKGFTTEANMVALRPIDPMWTKA